MLPIVTALIRLAVGKSATDLNSVQGEALWLISMARAILTSLLCQNPECMCSLQWQAGNKTQEKSCRSWASPGAGWHNFNWFECELCPFMPGLEFAPGMGWLSAASLNLVVYAPKCCLWEKSWEKADCGASLSCGFAYEKLTNKYEQFFFLVLLDFNFC